MMTLEATEGFNDIQANAFAALRSEPPEPSEVSTGSVEANKVDPAEVPAQTETSTESNEQPTPTEAESVKEPDELEAIQRTIASDPFLRAQYKAQKLGLPVEAFLPPAPQQQVQQQAQQVELPQAQRQAQSLEELFPEGFDSTDPEHQALLLQHQLSPFSAYIQQQQAEMQYQNQVIEYQAQQAQRAKLVDTLDEMVPGLKALDALPPEQMTPEHIAFGSFVEQRLARELEGIHPAYARDERVLNTLLKSIAPEVKALAAKLGIVQGKAVPNTQALASSHVESSTATPQASGSQFDELLKKGDLNKAAEHLFKRI